jgi:hypothetical protein
MLEMKSKQTTSVNGVLLLYHHALAANASTIMENVEAFTRLSCFKVWPVNVELGFPKSLSTLRFESIVLHYSVFGYWPYPLDNEFLGYLEQCHDSHKTAFFQDEYHFCKQRFDFLNRYQIDCVFTLIEPEYFKDVYQKYTSVPKLVYHIPGYVSDELIETARKKIVPDEERKIDVGYRARPLPFYMGRGAQEKTAIAQRFRERARNLGLRLDIETDEESRIYGAAWYDFIANCRGFLGVEAGVSIFDVEDVVRPEADRLLAENPSLSFDELSEQCLKPWEDRIYYRTISPRHFEAAAFRVCQILFEGRYSGLMQPMVHYIPLKKDFSNFDDCIRMFQDRRLRDELTGNAYRDLIASERYSYRNFIAGFDEVLLEAGLRKDVNEEQAVRVTQDLNRDRSALEFRLRKKTLRYHTDFPGRRALSLVGGPLLRQLRKLKGTNSN